MSNENSKPPHPANKYLSPKLIWYNSRIKLKFKESCLKQEDRVAYAPKNVINLLIVYELDTWPQNITTDFTLKNCLFGSVKLTKNVDLHKCKCSSYGIRFDLCSYHLLLDNTTRRNVIIFGADMNSYVHIDNKGKGIFPANICLDEDFLKTSFVFVIRGRLQDIFKVSWLRLIYSSWSYIFKTYSRRLQDVFKTSCQNIFKTSSRRLAKTSSRYPQNAFKTFCKDVFKTFSRRIIRVNCLPRSRIRIGHTSEKFMDSLENLQVS